MKFQYYWDHGIWPVGGHGSDISEGGDEMGTPADIQKLIQRAKRAQDLTDRAAKEGDGADAIMNNFEQTMNRFNAHFGGIAEYEKQIAAMLGADSNGGPPLNDATFQPPQAAPQQAPTSQSEPAFDHATGDPLKT